MSSAISRSLLRNEALLSDLLHTDNNSDIIHRSFQTMGIDCALYTVDGMSSLDQIAFSIMRPLLHAKDTISPAQIAQKVKAHLIESVDVQDVTTMEEIITHVTSGATILLFDGCTTALSVDHRAFVRRMIGTPQTETVVIGPHEAFNEVLRDNLTMLHRRLHTPELICEMISVGDKIPTFIALCYLKGVCKNDTVNAIKERIDSIHVDYIQTAGTLEPFLEDSPNAPLPQLVKTERPDRAVSFLLEGQAVLLMDGSPLALAMPITLWHLFHAPDDSYMRWQYGTFMRILRFFGASLGLLLPALFIVAVIYHPNTLPMTLLTSIIQSRTIVPISLLEEALLMLAVFYLINEAGIRIPGLMGSTLGLVSALILGTAAVDAGLVSPLLIIVVAFSGLGTYALPSYSLSFAFRIGQVVLLLAGGWFGAVGLFSMLLLLLCAVAGMESLHHPYLAPHSPARVHNPDLILRAPTYRQRLRTFMARPDEMLRAKGRMRGFDEGKKK